MIQIPGMALNAVMERSVKETNNNKSNTTHNAPNHLTHNATNAVIHNASDTHHDEQQYQSQTHLNYSNYASPINSSNSQNYLYSNLPDTSSQKESKSLLPTSSEEETYNVSTSPEQVPMFLYLFHFSLAYFVMDLVLFWLDVLPGFGTTNGSIKMFGKRSVVYNRYTESSFLFIIYISGALPLQLVYSL